MPSIVDQPAPYLAFALWHVCMGAFGVHLLNLRRFGIQSNVILRERRPTRNRSLHHWFNVASATWAAGLVAFALWPASRAHPLGAPLLAIDPWIGWIVAVVSHVAVVSGQLSMGRSFRIGEPRSDEVRLVEGGIHRWSRNPIYIASIGFLVGAWTWTPSIAAAVGVLALIASFHSIVLEEERFLSKTLGAPYDRYRERVPRYLGWPRRS